MRLLESRAEVARIEEAWRLQEKELEEEARLLAAKHEEEDRLFAAKWKRKEEALRRAMAASIQDETKPVHQQPTTQVRSHETEDEQLARAIAASLDQQSGQQQQDNNSSSCNVC